MRMSQLPDPAADTRTNWIALDLRYCLLAVAYLVMMGWFLGSRQEMGTASDFLVRLTAHVYHVPFYAGLGYFILQAISRGQALTAHRSARAVLTFTVTGTFAALAEWHRAYISGRDFLLGDLLLDMAGVAGFLFVCALGTDGDQ
jgi:VanZ family protein